MKELIRTNELILIMRIQGILNDAGIYNALLDIHASSIQGNIAAIQKRIVVSNDDFTKSKKILKGIINNEENE